MEKQIWKYELNTHSQQTIKMPKGAEILTVQNQIGIPCIWALVDPKAEMEDIIIETSGTGQAIGYDMGTSRKYIGTYQMAGGNLIFHVFQYTGI